MIVELYGLPASGKTTFAQELSASAPCQSNRQRPLRMLEVVRGLVLFPRLASILIWRTVRDNGLRETGYLLKNIILPRMGELGRAWHLRNQGIHVLDEGPLQALLSVGRNITEQQVRLVCACTPASIIVVCVPDSTEHIARMDKRLSVLRPYLDDGERNAWRASLQQANVVIVNMLRTDPRTQVVATSNDRQCVLEAVIACQNNYSHGHYAQRD